MIPAVPRSDSITEYCQTEMQVGTINPVYNHLCPMTPCLGIDYRGAYYSMARQLVSTSSGYTIM